MCNAIVNILPNTLGTSRTFENLLGTNWELDGNKEELENPNINPYPNHKKIIILGLLRA
jgi:hypothetical protein